MPEENNASKAALEELIKKNLEISKEVLEASKKIKNYMWWLRAMNIVKFVLIFASLAFGFLFAAPYLKQFQSAFKIYGELLGIESPVEEQQKPADNPDSVMDKIDELQKSGQLQKLLERYQKQ